MTLALPNPATRFPQAVAPLLNQKEQQYVLIDIGARDGMDPLWQSFHDILDFIGFEPDPKECAQLNADAQKYGNTRHRIYPHAIAGTEGPRPFYVTRFAFSSGLHKGNPAWLERFPFTNLDVLREIEITTTSLDKFCFQQSLDHVDFIKIDVEGAEYDVLEGSLNMLASQKVLGVKTEIWWDPIIKGQASFAEIDIFLRQQGFRFFDLDLQHFPRSTMPAGPIQGKFEDDGSLSVQAKIPRNYGQGWTGDALYFRDPVGEFKAGQQTISWDRESLLRLCGILDLYHYGDCALEILDFFRSTLLKDVDVDRLMDSLVPPVDGKLLPYADYQKASIQVRQHFNRSTYGTDWAPPPTGYKKKPTML